MQLEQIFQITVLRDRNDENKFYLIHNGISYTFTDTNELYAAIAEFAAARFEWR